MTKLRFGERRYQVFVSSTYLDLKEERETITSTLLESDAFPAGMELFPATNSDAWTLIQKVIDDSDYYLLVVGGKYGSIDSEADISYTEKEYDYAVQQGKPVMAFLHGEPKKLTVEQSEQTEDKQKRLATFRAKVEDSKHVKFWNTADDLAGKVALSYNKLTRQFPAVGWVRADQAVDQQTLAELNRAKDKIRELERSLEVATFSAPAGTSDLAQDDDEVIIPVNVRATFQSPSAPHGVKASSVEFYTTSWSGLLGALGPLMLTEADESSLKARLVETATTVELIDASLESLVKDATQEHPVLNNPTNPDPYEIDIFDEHVETVILQFKALGLITQSNKKRSVNDIASYWTLTPLGEQKTVQAKARKRKSKETTLASDETEGSTRDVGLAL